MIIGPNESLRLQFDPTKSHVEKKTFNGQSTEKIAHSVVNVDDRAAGEKILSLTYKQSQPVEEAMEQGYTGKPKSKNVRYVFYRSGDPPCSKR